MRHRHYIRKGSSTAAPSEIIVVDCETTKRIDTSDCAREYHTLRLGWAVAYRLEDGKRTREEWVRFETPEVFWNFVRSRLSRQRPVWVFAHNALFDLTVLKAWQELEGPEWEWNRVILECPPFLLDGWCGQSGIVFCDTLNYFKASLAQLGKSLGKPKLSINFDSCSVGELSAYCRNDVEITALAIDKLISFHREFRLGSWRPTIAGLAMSAYTTRFMPCNILVHDHKRALLLERKSYYGGMVWCGRIGNVPWNPVYHLDVNSMFPAAMLSPMPAKFVRYTDRIGMAGLRRLLENFVCVARVRMLESSRLYPMRETCGVVYPHGSFETVLCGAELLSAMRGGAIQGVSEVAYYEPADLFSDYVKFFHHWKQEHQRIGDDGFRTVDKYYLTNLYGKFGQSTPFWHEWNEEAFNILCKRFGLPPNSLLRHAANPPDLYQPHERYNVAELGIDLHVRHYFDRPEVIVGKTESRDSCPIIAACVTAKARCMLNDMIQCVGWENHGYSDTDSIFTSESGYRKLVDGGYVNPDELGKLALEGTFNTMVVYGPKDYETDSKIRTKGIRSDASLWCHVCSMVVGERISRITHCPRCNAPLLYQQVKFAGPPSCFTTGRRGEFLVETVRKKLNRKNDRFITNPDGSTRPLIYPDERPPEWDGKDDWTGENF